MPDNAKQHASKDEARTSTQWYDMSPSVIEGRKGPTRHKPLEHAPAWQTTWVAGFIEQQGKLLTLLKLLADDELGLGGEHCGTWLAFLATELATWLELLVDQIPVYDERDLAAAFEIWGTRHASLGIHSPRLARLMAQLRDAHYQAKQRMLFEV